MILADPGSEEVNWLKSITNKQIQVLLCFLPRPGPSQLPDIEHLEWKSSLCTFNKATSRYLNIILEPL